MPETHPTFAEVLAIHRKAEKEKMVQHRKTLKAPESQSWWNWLRSFVV